MIFLIDGKDQTPDSHVNCPYIIRTRGWTDTVCVCLSGPLCCANLRKTQAIVAVRLIHARDRNAFHRGNVLLVSNVGLGSETTKYVRSLEFFIFWGENEIAAKTKCRGNFSCTNMSLENEDSGKFHGTAEYHSPSETIFSIFCFHGKCSSQTCHKGLKSRDILLRPS